MSTKAFVELVDAIGRAKKKAAYYGKPMVVVQGIRDGSYFAVHIPKDERAYTWVHSRFVCAVNPDGTPYDLPYPVNDLK